MVKIRKTYIWSSPVDFREKPQGVGFFSVFFSGGSKNKNPTPGAFGKFQALDFVSAA